MLVTWQFHNSHKNKDFQRFQLKAELARNNIEARINMYVAMLRGTAGLFAASEFVTEEEFREYISRLELKEFYPGIRGIGLSIRISPENLGMFVAARRRAGHENFNVWPLYERDEYHTITYLEPLDERNKAAIGYDMYTESVRKTAMQTAVETGMPAASGRVILMQEIDEDVQAGFLIYVPIYKDGPVPETVEERRKNLLGFVYAPFRADDLLRGIFPVPQTFAMEFKVFDGADPENAEMLHNSYKFSEPLPDGYKPRFVSTRSLQIAGRTWTVIFSGRPEFSNSPSWEMAPVVFASGLLLSLIISAISWSEARARREFERQAEWLRRSQEELSESQARLLENDRRKDEFLAVLAHELRNPLAPVYSAIQIMQRSENKPEIFNELSKLMEEQVSHMIRLVDDLMDISRITRGKIELRMQPLGIQEIISSSVEAVKSIIEERGHELNINIPSQPILVMADMTRLSQVFANLLNNAAKYTPPGGRIDIDVWSDDDTVSVAVKDNGIGIKEEKRDYIFDMFTQVSDSGINTYGGLGIGLTLVKNFVQMHGGSVEVSSENVGNGSTFTVNLPVYKPRLAAV